MFSQPILEECLRKIVAESPDGDFRTGAEVVELSEDENGTEVSYRDVRTGETKVIRAKYVVGTDGRRGFVRKKYLETKGILLERVHPGELLYCGINWDVFTPTPKTHPDFPLWAKGYSPEAVLDEFMPANFKYMCNPDRNGVMCRAGVWSTASGIARLWRTEFALRPGESPDEMSKQNAVALLLEPYMTHSGKRFGLLQDVTFPEDCMQPRRSWVYKFESRICNRWWNGRVMLAGDAAHVFPPHGGLGVTQGFLDVSNLAWRLALAVEIKQPPNLDNLWNAWEMERKSNVKQSLQYTHKMGDIFEEKNPVKLLIREVLMWFLQLIPYIRTKVRQPSIQSAEYEYSPGASFLPNLGGGKAFFQCHCRRLDKDSPVILSDDVVFADKKKPFGLMVLADSVADAVAAQKELSISHGSNDLVTNAVYIVNSLEATPSVESQKINIVRLVSGLEFAASELCEGRHVPGGYDDHGLRKQYRGKRFVVARADKVVFAACKDLEELSPALEAVERVRNFEAA